MRYILWSVLRLGVFWIAAISAHPALAAADHVSICDDQNQLPPFMYYDPANGTTLTGAAIEIVDIILKDSGFQYDIELLPWVRCLSDTESGRRTLILNAAYSDERNRKFLIGPAIYQIHGALFYARDHFPKVPILNSTDDLKNYKFCGLHGYNYTMYAIPESNIDSSAHDEFTRIKMLRGGRCDFMVGDIEFLKGFAKINGLDLSGVDQIPIPGGAAKPIHVLITRNSPMSEALLRAFRVGLDKIKADGTYDRIMHKYGID